MARKKTATVNITARMKEPLRARIERSAKARGASMNAEIVRRLDQSFALDDRLGGAELAGMIEVAAAAMKTTGEHAAFLATGKVHKDGRWLAQPFAFDQAAKAAARVLEGFRPPGEIVQPTPNIAEVVGGDEASAAATYAKVMGRLGDLFGDKTLQEIGKGDDK